MKDQEEVVILIRWDWDSSFDIRCLGQMWMSF